MCFARLLALFLGISVAFCLRAEAVTPDWDGHTSTIETLGDFCDFNSFGSNVLAISAPGTPGRIVANATYPPGSLRDLPLARVPQINPAWSAVVSCLAAAVLIFRHRAHVRK